MTTKVKFVKGAALEARVQRLFMCQGALAERALFLRASPNSARLVTDIDVLARDYNLNLHEHRAYAECKGGKNVSTLDRIIWIAGIMRSVGADTGFLVLEHCDSESVEFARSQGVQILQAAGLEAMERAIGIGADFWPGRSNLCAYVEIEKRIEQLIGGRDAGGFCDWLRSATDMRREAASIDLSYGRLNALLRTVAEGCAVTRPGVLLSGHAIHAEYAIAALLVRLSQYVLFAAADTLGMTRTERESYLCMRLTAGSLTPDQFRATLSSALGLAKSRLEEKGVEPPATWTVDHMSVAPAHAKPFAQVVERVIGDGHRARILPLAMELRLFGFSGNEKASGGLLRQVNYAMPMTGLVRGLAMQSLGLPEEYASGPVGSVKGVACPRDSAPASALPHPPVEGGLLGTDEKL